MTEGVPANIVRKVMGHEQTSTTLDLYTHMPADYEARVIAAFEAAAVFPLRSEPEDLQEVPDGEWDDMP